MAKIEPFEEHMDQYEAWFTNNPHAYRSEVEAIRRHIPEGGRGLEIGVGSGLFAVPLGIRHGVEPSARMRAMAVARGVEVVETSLQEARRVVRPGGRVVVALVDKDSRIGSLYQKYQHENVFYRHATFYTTDEVRSLMERAGLRDFLFSQTIFRMLDELTEPEEVREGYGDGSFVVVSALA